MADPEAREVIEKAGLALLLSCCGGFVDAVCFLTLAHLFTAHMSGNSAAAGAYFGTGTWDQAFHRAFPIPLFVGGVLLGSILVESLRRRGTRSPYAVSFAAEVALLALFLGCGQAVFHEGEVRPGSAWAYYALAALPALAMGYQNATLRKVGHATVRTTYITGALTDFAEEVVGYGFWLRDKIRGGEGRLGSLLRQAPWNPTVGRAALHLGTWVTYIGGAALGGLAESTWELFALLAPIACLAALALLDLVRPVTIVRPYGGS